MNGFAFCCHRQVDSNGLGNDSERQAMAGNGELASMNGTAVHGEAMDASTIPNGGAVSSLQDEILAQGPEAADLHAKIAALFSGWLAEEKAAAAEAERRRKQFEADNVCSRSSCCSPRDPSANMQPLQYQSLSVI